MPSALLRQEFVVVAASYDEVVAKKNLKNLKRRGHSGRWCSATKFHVYYSCYSSYRHLHCRRVYYH